MFNFTLYRREIKGLWKVLLVLSGVLTMYISIIISMFDPEMQKSLNDIAEMMPGFMDAMGFSASDTSLLGFLRSYLYGFLLIAFPMVFSILSGNKLIAKYTDKGSMVSLLSAPVKRVCVAFTQMKVLASGLFFLIAYSSILEILISQIMFSGELDIEKLLTLNLGLFCLHIFIGGICFFCSCLFSDTKNSIAFGAGIPSLMLILQMLANTGGAAEKAKYFTFFTLFDSVGLINGENSALVGIAILFLGGVVLFASAIAVFSKKDLHI